MNVVSLCAVRQEREPRWVGPCVCLGCRHEWDGEGPLPVSSIGITCPSCGMTKGVVKHLFAANVGDRELQCSCGCEALTAYKPAGTSHLRVRCMACGNDLTQAFFE